MPDGEFKDDFLADTSEITVRSGDYLSEDALEKETELRASAMRRKGYFGFTKNYFSFEADTLNSPDTAGLLMTVKEYTRNQTPEYARPHRKYYMGKVTLSYDKDLKFNDKVLRNMCTLHPGDLYDENEVNTTYSRLSALKMFSGVNVSMNPQDSGIVDCDITLTRSRMQGFKVIILSSSKTDMWLMKTFRMTRNIFLASPHGARAMNLETMTLRTLLRLQRTSTMTMTTMMMMISNLHTMKTAISSMTVQRN